LEKKVRTIGVFGINISIGVTLMDYASHYEKLMNRSKNRNLPGYYEVHHVIPRCMGGDDSKTNLVKLTPEEHYLAYLLLCKMYPGNKKLLYAANIMTTGLGGKRSNNKSFGWLRKKMSEESMGPNNHMYGKKLSNERKLLSSHPGEKNPFYGKRHTDETKKIISEKKKGKSGLSGEKNGMYGKKHSDATKLKISENNPWKGTSGTGKHPNCGRKVSDYLKDYYRKLYTGKKVPEEELHKWRKPKGPQKQLVCPVCNKSGGAANMKRYHFENCKENT